VARRTAALVASLVLAGAAGATLDPTDHPDPGLRERGVGQIRFQGHGPEWWASRSHRLETALRGEQTRTEHLQRLLASRLEQLVWLVQAFLCIHQHEAQTWDTNTGNGYFGGLQFDLTFQRTYGRRLLQAKGTADNWTPSEQLAVAITAYRSRGFHPWPQTARMCGLL
jgi:hypothetical protein